MSLRSLFKTTVLIASLAESLARFAMLRARLRLQNHRGPTARERAVWLHGCCHRILSRLDLQLTTNKSLPDRGLIVSNHLSHLDILLFGSLGPMIFVAKEEVRRWPLLGKLAECGGTVFVDRDRPAQAAIAAEQIENCLRGDIPVLLFPEGTSSDGTQVLPFRSPLFEPAIRADAPISAAAIGYSAKAVEESTLTYWGDKVFFPHLWATLGCKHLGGTIAFGEVQRHEGRKHAARATHQQVCDLRSCHHLPAEHILPTQGEPGSMAPHATCV